MKLGKIDRRDLTVLILALIMTGLYDMLKNAAGFFVPEQMLNWDTLFAMVASIVIIMFAVSIAGKLSKADTSKK
jgi:hypothetical protein